MKQQHRILGSLAALVLLVASGCAKTPPNTSPEAKIAIEGTRAVGYVRAAQRAVIESSLPRAQKEAILKPVYAVYDAGDALHRALTELDAIPEADRASSSALKQAQNALRVFKSAVAGVAIPSSVTKAVDAIDLALESILKLAKVLGLGPEAK